MSTQTQAQTQSQTQTHVHSHVRRRSRVSIQVLPETAEVEESEKPLLSDLSDRDSGSDTARSHGRQASQDSVTLGQIDILVPRPERKGVPWRVLLVFTTVTALCCLATAAIVAHQGDPGPKRSTSRDRTVAKTRRRACNPYHEFGVLNVSLSTPSENVWQPIAAAEDCQPSNYLDMLAQQHPSLPSRNPKLEFLRGRTILIYGDSIDRDHVDDVCGFVGGRYELIHDKHPLSPPYPAGQELPPPGYKNPITGERTWLQNGQSRPWICHIPQLDARIINVFHFGFQDLSPWLENSPHYYPPATIEERFDMIAVPLVEAVAKRYDTKPNPDLVSVAPGFWTLLRETIDKQLEYDDDIENGLAFEEAHTAWRGDVWRTPSEHNRLFYEKRITQILRRVATAWPETRGSRQPSLLWRAPHFVKETDRTPYNRLVALDQIGRSVAARLAEEGDAAQASRAEWKRWRRSASAASAGFDAADRSWARKAKLGERLRVDEWGARMLGQSQYFRDDIHPSPLPGSYLYGNMLFEHLRLFEEDRAASQSAVV